MAQDTTTDRSWVGYVGGAADFLETEGLVTEADAVRALDAAHDRAEAEIERLRVVLGEIARYADERAAAATGTIPAAALHAIAKTARGALGNVEDSTISAPADNLCPRCGHHFTEHMLKCIAYVAGSRPLRTCDCPLSRYAVDGLLRLQRRQDTEAATD